MSAHESTVQEESTQAQADLSAYSADPITSSASAGNDTHVGEGAETSDATNETVKPPNPRVTALHKKKAALTTQLEALQAEFAARVRAADVPDLPPDASFEQRSQRVLEDAQTTVKEHIAKLHQYNEIKDIGLGLMGLIAEQRGVRQIVVMEEFGITPKD